MQAPRIAQPAPENAFHAAHVDCLLASYAKLTGDPLYRGQLQGAERAAALWQADFALLSHGTEPDPLFNYGNRKALELFEIEWPDFVLMPSRKSAEPAEQATRERFMHEVASRGYIDNYTGVRISARGRRFTIDKATVWNVFDNLGTRIGQAATFAYWTPLSG